MTDTDAAYKKAMQYAVAKAQAEVDEAERRLEQAKKHKEEADRERAEADADAKKYDKDAADISDCQMAAARALIECLAPLQIQEEGVGNGMTCGGFAGPCGDASVASSTDGCGQGDDATVGLTTEVDGGSCSCDNEDMSGSAELTGQLSLWAQTGGGVVDPSPQE